MKILLFFYVKTFEKLIKSDSPDLAAVVEESEGEGSVSCSLQQAL